MPRLLPISSVLLSLSLLACTDGKGDGDGGDGNGGGDGDVVNTPPTAPVVSLAPASPSTLDDSSRR